MLSGRSLVQIPAGPTLRVVFRKGNLSNSVFERRTSTGSGLFESLHGQWFGLNSQVNHLFKGGFPLSRNFNSFLILYCF